mmetsp:Transcript_88857/g.256249  ORF Transcript_88857/g.256249 Transcript_88857/m.256249 type:complete len:271 (+) Transcript_88857:652-1464(+)
MAPPPQHRRSLQLPNAFAAHHDASRPRRACRASHLLSSLATRRHPIRVRPGAAARSRPDEQTATTLASADAAVAATDLGTGLRPLATTRANSLRSNAGGAPCALAADGDGAVAARPAAHLLSRLPSHSQEWRQCSPWDPANAEPPAHAAPRAAAASAAAHGCTQEVAPRSSRSQLCPSAPCLGRATRLRRRRPVAVAALAAKRTRCPDPRRVHAMAAAEARDGRRPAPAMASEESARASSNPEAARSAAPEAGIRPRAAARPTTASTPAS